MGPNKYKNIVKNKASSGNKSKKNEKNKISDIKNIEPGKPKNINKFIRQARNNLGQIKLIPLISVISLVLNRRAIASTNKNEFVDNKAWLINMQKFASNKLD